MSQTIDPNVQKLTALNGYMEFLLSKFPAPEEDVQEDPLILILVCMQKTLERRINKTLPTVEWVNIMRWSVVEANKLIDVIYEQSYEAVADWNPTATPQNMQQNLCAMLMVTQHELIADVAEAEAYLANQLTTAAEEFRQRKPLLLMRLATWNWRQKLCE
jgi:hypothetical protein